MSPTPIPELHERVISSQVMIIIKQNLSLILSYTFGLEGVTFAKAYCIILIIPLICGWEKYLKPLLSV